VASLPKLAGGKQSGFLSLEFLPALDSGRYTPKGGGNPVEDPPNESLEPPWCRVMDLELVGSIIEVCRRGYVRVRWTLLSLRFLGGERMRDVGMNFTGSLERC
jgi:hypothetical protein